jgi:UTP--glucose-1-phosphate uridylyltransferase
VNIVIPAAGVGSRFLPTSRVVPKELLPFGNKPLIHHALDEAERAGFTKALVVVSAQKKALRMYFEQEPALERMLEAREDEIALALVREAAAIAQRLKLTFVEQPEPLGLGDAVFRCRPDAGGCFAVLLPDDVVTGNAHWGQLLRLREQTGAACVCVRQVAADQAHRFGIADCESTDCGLAVRELVEKPAGGRRRSALAIFGRYVVTEPVLNALEALRPRPPGGLQLTDGLAAVVGRPPGVLAVRFTAEFFDSHPGASFTSITEGRGRPQGFLLDPLVLCEQLTTRLNPSRGDPSGGAMPLA